MFGRHDLCRVGLMISVAVVATAPMVGACRPVGIFSGPLVVSMRPLTPTHAIRAARNHRAL